MGEDTQPGKARAPGVLSRFVSGLFSRVIAKSSDRNYTPERLANVLIRRFDVAFVAIPAAIFGSGSEAVSLLSRTGEVLREEGGFATRIALVGFFFSVLEQQSTESLSAFCEYVTRNETIQATFGEEEKGRRALDAVRAIHRLAGDRESGRKTAWTPEVAARTQGEEEIAAEEWTTLELAAPKLANPAPPDERASIIASTFAKAPHLTFLRRPLEDLFRIHELMQDELDLDRASWEGMPEISPKQLAGSAVVGEQSRSVVSAVAKANRATVTPRLETRVLVYGAQRDALGNERATGEGTPEILPDPAVVATTIGSQSARKEGHGRKYTAEHNPKKKRGHRRKYTRGHNPKKKRGHGK